MYPTTKAYEKESPLVLAVEMGAGDVVHVFLTTDGLKAIGGADNALHVAMIEAVRKGRRRLLHLVLNAKGEEERLKWMDSPSLAEPLLRYAADYIIPNPARILLTKGMDETTTDAAGQRAIDAIGNTDKEYPPVDYFSPRTVGRCRDPVKEADIRRTLLQGPAFRAQSLAWPTGV